MKVSTWNVNGIRAREQQVAEWVAVERPDVICLQEIKASPENVPAALCSMEGYWCYWHGHKGYSGVALHLRREFFGAAPQYVHPEFDHENRIVTVDMGSYVFASIYVPNGGKDFPAKVRFLGSLEKFVAQADGQGKKVVLCGDLNVARTAIDVHPRLRNPKQIGQTPEEQALLERVIGHHLVDLGRAFDPSNERLFTWWAPWRNMRQRNIGWRLDYVLASESLARKTTRCNVAPEFGTSDHAPVTAVFDVTSVDVVGSIPPATSPPVANTEVLSSKRQLGFDFK